MSTGGRLDQIRLIGKEGADLSDLSNIQKIVATINDESLIRVTIEELSGRR